MKLHWSPRSPFVRKVMILAYETGLDEKIQLVRTQVAMTEPNHGLIKGDNPLGKIPTLVLEDGRVLHDSPVICEYLDALHGEHRFFPQAPESKWLALTRQSLGDGMLELLVLWRNERIKPAEKQTKALLDAFQLKMTHALAALEKQAGALAASGFDIGHVAIGCALCYIDFRFPDIDWRKGHAALAAWHKGFDSRPAVQRTNPKSEEEAA